MKHSDDELAELYRQALAEAAGTPAFPTSPGPQGQGVPENAATYPAAQPSFAEQQAAYEAAQIAPAPSAPQPSSVSTPTSATPAESFAAESYPVLQPTQPIQPDGGFPVDGGAVWPQQVSGPSAVNAGAASAASPQEAAAPAPSYVTSTVPVAESFPAPSPSPSSTSEVTMEQLIAEHAAAQKAAAVEAGIVAPQAPVYAEPPQPVAQESPVQSSSVQDSAVQEPSGSASLPGESAPFGEYAAQAAAASAAEPAPAEPVDQTPNAPVAEARVRTESLRSDTSGAPSTVTPVFSQPAAAERLPLPQQTRVFAISNQKGGVGKTTTTVNMAVALAQSGAQVLVIDLDPQGNASTALGIDHRSEVTSVYDVIVNDVPLGQAIQASAEAPGLYCVPATIHLAGAEIELVSLVAREQRLRGALERFLRESGTGFHYIFIDCPPSLGLLTINAFVAANEVLIPIQCEYYALEGLSQLLKNIELIQKHLNPRLSLSSILLTMFDQRTRLASQVAEEVRGHFPKETLSTIIPRSVRVSEAPSYGQTVITYDSTSPGSVSYLEAARELAYRGPVGR